MKFNQKVRKWPNNKLSLIQIKKKEMYCHNYQIIQTACKTLEKLNFKFTEIKNPKNSIKEN